MNDQPEIKKSSVPTTEDLRLVIKLMGLTQSSSDAESLMAIRKANDKIKALGWDWEGILSAKITIIEDPFKSLEAPRLRDPDYEQSKPSAPPKPKTKTPPQRPAPPPSPSQSQYAAYQAQTAAYQASAAQAQAVYNAAMQANAARQAKSKPVGLVNSQTPNKQDGFCYCCGQNVPAWMGALFQPNRYGITAKVYSKASEIICEPCNQNPGLKIPMIKSKGQSPSLADLDL